MPKLRGYFILFTLVLVQVGVAWAQSPQIAVGRFQLVSISTGQQAGVFLVDTATGCTWQLGANPETKRLTFIEMDVENLHWSWGSGAQQKLAQKIDESQLPEDQKNLLKQELNKTACGWTPAMPTPSPPAASKPEAAPSQRR